MGAPVGNTCPTIDNGIKIVDNAIQDLKYIISKSKDLSLSDIEDIIESVYRNLEDVEGHFETLREANSSLRGWGEDLENEVGNLVYIIAEMQDEIDELREKL